MVGRGGFEPLLHPVMSGVLYQLSYRPNKVGEAPIKNLLTTNLSVVSALYVFGLCYSDLVLNSEVTTVVLPKPSVVDDCAKNSIV